MAKPKAQPRIIPKPPTGLKVKGRSQANRPMTADDNPQRDEELVEKLTPAQKAARTRRKRKEQEETSQAPVPETDSEQGRDESQIGEPGDTPTGHGEHVDNDPTDAEHDSDEE